MNALTHLLEKYDIALINETWFTELIRNSDVSNTHIIYRKDRLTRAGGVLIAVNEKLQSNQLVIESDSESVYVEVRIETDTLLLVSFYASPDKKADYICHLFDTLNKLDFSKYSSVIVGGDFNADANWVTLTSQSIKGKALIECVMQSPFEQIQTNYSYPSSHETSPTKVLDILLVKSNSYVTCNLGPKLAPSCDHLSIEFCISFKDTSRILNTTLTKQVNDYARIDTELITKSIRNVNWRTCFDGLDEDAAFDYLYDTLSGIFDLIPKKTVKITPKSILKKSTIHFSKLVRKFFALSKNRSDLRLKYTYLEKRLHRLIAIDHEDHIKSLCVNKDFSKFFRHLKDSRREADTKVFLSDTNELLTNDKDVAEAFQTQFADVISCGKDILENESFHKDPIAAETTLKMLLRVNSKKSRGPYSFPIKLIHMFACALAFPMSTFFNHISRLGIPTKLKEAIVTPVMKKGKPKNLISSYRPISNTSFIMRAYEKVYVEKLVSFLDENEVLPKSQYGYRKKLSTESCLFNFYYHVTSLLDKSRQVDVIFFDLKSAFDLVQHDLLIDTLRDINVPGDILSFFKSFLSGRSQTVKFRTSMSRKVRVTKGTPQGTVSAPVLFCIFIRKLESILRYCKIFQFADDFAIVYSVTCLEDCLKVQVDIDNIFRLMEELGMLISSSKTVFMSFLSSKLVYCSHYNICGNPIQSVSSVTYLGVVFDNCLKFDKHLNLVTQKVWGAWRSILKKYSKLTIAQKGRLYKTYVQPLIDYGACVYINSVGNLDTVESLQGTVLRNICFSSDSYITNSEARTMTNVLTVETRLVKCILKTAYSVANKSAPIQVQSIFDTRTSRDRQCINTLSCRLAVSSNSHIVRIPRLWSLLQKKDVEFCNSKQSTFYSKIEQYAKNFSLFGSMYF